MIEREGSIYSIVVSRCRIHVRCHFEVRRSTIQNLSSTVSNVTVFLHRIKHVALRKLLERDDIKHRELQLKQQIDDMDG